MCILAVLLHHATEITHISIIPIEYIWGMALGSRKTEGLTVTVSYCASLYTYLCLKPFFPIPASLLVLLVTHRLSSMFNHTVCTRPPHASTSYLSTLLYAGIAHNMPPLPRCSDKTLPPLSCSSIHHHHHIVPYRITSHRITSHHITSHHPISHHNTSPLSPSHHYHHFPP